MVHIDVRQPPTRLRVNKRMEEGHRSRIQECLGVGQETLIKQIVKEGPFLKTGPFNVPYTSVISPV